MEDTAQAVAEYYRAIEAHDAEVARQVRDGERFPVTWAAGIQGLREDAAEMAAEGDVDGLRQLWRDVASWLSNSPCPNALVTVLADIEEAADIAKAQPWHYRVPAKPEPPLSTDPMGSKYKQSRRKRGLETVTTARKGLTVERMREDNRIYWKG